MEKLKLKKLIRKIRNVAMAESCQIASQIASEHDPSLLE